MTLSRATLQVLVVFVLVYICRKRFKATDQISHYVRTSGTTSGKSKLIPVPASSPMSLGLFPLLIFKTIWVHNKFKLGKSMLYFKLFPNQSHKTKPVNNGMSFLLGTLLEKKMCTPTSPIETFYLDEPDCFHRHILYALAEPHLTTIYAYFLRSVLQIADYMYYNSTKLLHDIELLISSEHVGRKHNRLCFHPSRVSFLKRQFKTHQGLVRRVWPQLTLIVCGASGNEEFYLPQVRHYIDDIDIYSPLYASTEALMGINTLVALPARYTLYPIVAAYSFVKVENVDCEQLFIDTHSAKHIELDLVKTTNQRTIQLIGRKCEIINGFTQYSIMYHLHSCFGALLHEYTFIDNHLYLEFVARCSLARACKYTYACQLKQLFHVDKVVRVPSGTFAKMIPALTLEGLTSSQIKIPRVASGQVGDTVLKIITQNL